MDVVLIAPEAFLHQEDAPYVKNIRAAGMDIIYPDDPTFTRGHKSEEETIEQLSKCQAIIAGGEFFTENVFAALPSCVARLVRESVTIVLMSTLPLGMVSPSGSRPRPTTNRWQSMRSP